MKQYNADTCEVICEDNGKKVIADVLAFNEGRNLTVSLNKSIKLLMPWNGRVYEGRMSGMSFVSSGPKLPKSKMADKGKTFIVALNPGALEWVIDVTGYSKRMMWEVLKGSEPMSLTANLHAAIIRRHWADGLEVYSVPVDEEVSEKELIGLITRDFARAKELIRERGKQLYTNLKESYEDRA